MRTFLVMRKCPTCRYRVPIDKYDDHIKAHQLPKTLEIGKMKKDGTDGQ